jgi:uncharacterized DUF497 family protein
MTEEIVFEWDENKRQRNWDVHKIDFAEAAEVFDDCNISIVPDIREDYGESRFNAYGLSKGRKIRVCFTWRGENVIRVISMFKVHNIEWRKYYEKND